EPADSPTPAAVGEARSGATADHQSVISLVQALVAEPSRGGLDPYEPIIDLVAGWLGDHGISSQLIQDRETGEVVGIASDVVGANPGPRYVLDACIDTAPFGDETAWRHPPTAAAIDDGWLYGRGAADSKAAIAIFLHVAARLREQAAQLHGSLTL